MLNGLVCDRWSTLPQSFPQGDTIARQRVLEIRVFPLLCELPKTIEPHQPFISYTAGNYVAPRGLRLRPGKPSNIHNTRSSSYNMPLLTVGQHLLIFSSLWKSILDIVSCAPSLSSSKFRLKTYLFRSVHKD